MLVFAPTTNLAACDVSCIREAVPGRAAAQDQFGSLNSLGSLISGLTDLARLSVGISLNVSILSHSTRPSEPATILGGKEN